MHIASGWRAAGVLRLLFPGRGGQSKSVEEASATARTLLFREEYSAAWITTQSLTTPQYGFLVS